MLLIGVSAGKPAVRELTKGIEILVQKSKRINCSTKSELTENAFVSFNTRPCLRWSAKKLKIYNLNTSIWLVP